MFLAIALLYGVYQNFVPSWSLAFAVVPIAIVQILKHKIDTWWWQKHPPKLDKPLVDFLEKSYPYFQRLKPEDKEKFCDRVALFLEHKEFVPKVTDAIPEVIKTLVAASAVKLTFGSEDYLFDNYGQVVIYPDMFPSPQKQFVHASEHHDEGMWAFAAKSLIVGSTQNLNYFDVAIYEMAQGLNLVYPEISHEQLDKIRGAKLDELLKQTGLQEMDLGGRMVEHFFVRPDEFHEFEPAIYEQLIGLLNQDPRV